MYSSYFVIKEREIVAMRKKSVIHYAIFRTSESILHEILKRRGNVALLLSETSKLYIPYTLNIDLIVWHTQLIVCAVKC